MTFPATFRPRPTGEPMTQDRQIDRFTEARRRQHAAAQAHRQTQHELDAASAELITAAAALAERLRLLNGLPVAHGELRAA